MQNRGIIIAVSVLAALVCVVLAVSLISLIAAPKSGSTVAAVAPAGAENVNTVAVYGQGKIAITPDMATITFGYENRDKDAKAAQDANKAQMDKIMNAVKRTGVSDSQIQTAIYSVNRDSTQNQFTVCNMMQVQIVDIGKTSDIIKAASDSGANQFWDVRFDIVKRQQAYTDALSLAMDRAREKAEKLAADEGKRVLDVLSIEEGTEDNSYWYSSPYTNFVSGPSSSSGSYSDVGISSGEMEISALVNVVYRIS